MLKFEVNWSLNTYEWIHILQNFLFFTERDPCESNPCINGGNCTTIDSLNFQCECIDGFAGVNCGTGMTLISCPHKITYGHKQLPHPQCETVAKLFIFLLRICNDSAQSHIILNHRILQNDLNNSVAKY